MALNKILLALDESEYGLKGVKLLEDFYTYNKNITVVVAHVIEPVDPFRPILKEEFQVEASKMVAHTIKGLHEKGIQSKVRIENGNVAERLLDIAANEGAELIIMGAKGHGNIAGILLGSISHKVLQKSHIPVLIAK